jgi:steroid delta-isomerase
MLRHAEEWIAAWNCRDVETVLADFSENAIFISPRAAAMTGSPVVRGKGALHAYWTMPAPPPRFVLDHVVCDPEGRAMAVVYDRLAADGTRTRGVEIMRFDHTGRQIAGEALLGAVLHD